MVSYRSLPILLGLNYNVEVFISYRRPEYKLCTATRKKITSRGVTMRKKKIGGITTHFSEIIKLQFGKTGFFFLDFCCLVISKKCAVTPNFLSGFK